MEEICWIDTANQISNSWYKKTCICIYFERNEKTYGLTIDQKIKLKIKDKLKDFEEKVIAGNLQAYLIYIISKELNLKNEITKTYICPDFQPIHEYDKYLQRCFSYHGKIILFKIFNFKFKQKETKSKAHSKVRKIYSNQRKADYIFNYTDYQNFIKYFINQNYKKKNQVNSP